MTAPARPLPSSGSGLRSEPRARSLAASRSRLEGSAPPGWTLSDLAVAALAVVVIGLSIAGLVWLMRAG